MVETARSRSRSISYSSGSRSPSPPRRRRHRSSSYSSSDSSSSSPSPKRSPKERPRKPSVSPRRKRSVSPPRRRSISPTRRNNRELSPVRRARTPPQENREVLIKGLTKIISAEHLKEMLSEYGLIKKVEIQNDDKTGYSRGFATAEFDKHQDAVKAIEHLDEGQIDGKIVRVCFKDVTKHQRNNRRRSPRGRPYSPPRHNRRGSQYRGRGGRGSDDRYRDNYNRRRSPSPYDRRRRDYSRSRSRSPVGRRQQHHSPEPTNNQTNTQKTTTSDSK
ncbi:hypothetical protein AKO1_011236 [Acrasis kona]|uniref:RRM domain-containing protein n=1 Tax=Acrasis kona TaxID=1008807 RepID=A0AAW2YVN2_9EUKA